MAFRRPWWRLFAAFKNADGVALRMGSTGPEGFWIALRIPGREELWTSGARFWDAKADQPLYVLDTKTTTWIGPSGPVTVSDADRAKLWGYLCEALERGRIEDWSAHRFLTKEEVEALLDGRIKKRT